MFRRFFDARKFAYAASAAAAAGGASFSFADAGCDKRAPAAMISERPETDRSPSRDMRARVRKRDGVDGRPMWVTYKNGVYDITEFCRIHPGGHIIKQAAGSNVEIFWQVWSYHHLVPKVGEYLDELRIGTLDDQDDVPMDDDPYGLEPVRSTSKQRVRERPYCSEHPIVSSHRPILPQLMRCTYGIMPRSRIALGRHRNIRRSSLKRMTQKKS